MMTNLSLSVVPLQTLSAAQLSKPGAGITLEPSEEDKAHTKKSLLECWPGFGRSQVAWSSEVFPVRNPCWGCFPWLSQGEGTTLEFLQPQAGEASPENRFRLVHLTLPPTCGFQGAFWSCGYSQERIFQHLLFKPGIPSPELSRPHLRIIPRIWKSLEKSEERRMRKPGLLRRKMRKCVRMETAATKGWGRHRSSCSLVSLALPEFLAAPHWENLG
ncbi:uncharacterized protein LOC125327380 isoform X2 [Corvus hawaiiensis]|uniref:uncharacterized protein LOC125327380 isoform X2 n=1 Tax=Corvus hawaiiensis TaxID=134902 RepID=UPI002019AEF2|nr:uncharacterized protein LOC125327380 isoform X2 [Corvus hawaiiensis]